MRALKIVWLAVTFITLVLGPTAIGRFIRESRNPEFGLDPSARPRALIASGSYDAALESCDFLISHDLDHDGSVTETRRELLSRINSVSGKAKSFFWGGLTGKIEDSSSLVGCITADMTAYGDVRDLAKSAYAYATGEEVDELIVALSALGLATTLAPHIDVGISVCKNLGRFMSKALRTHIIDLALEAKKLGNLGKISGLVSDIGGLYRKIGGGIIDLFKMAGDVPALQKLTKLVDTFGRPAFGAILVGGKGTLRFLGMASDAGLKLAGAGGKKMIRMAVLYPNVAVHLVKISKKAGWDHPDLTMTLLAELLGALPLHLIFLISLAIWLWCSWWTILETLFFRPTANPA